MNRRDFVKFLGVSSASLPIANALAKIPEVEPQIILLDKPKDIIIAKDLPNIVIRNLISISYTNNDNVHMYETATTPHLSSPSIGSRQVSIQIEYCFLPNEVNLFKKMIEARTFTFDLHFENSKHSHLMALNGRMFMMSEYSINTDQKSEMTVQIEAIELYS